MPQAEFAAQLAARPFGLATILELAELFGASIEATAIRTMKQTSLPAAVVFCHYALKPSEAKMKTAGDRPVPRLRVRRAYRSPSFQGFIPPHSSIPKDSPFHEALGGADIVRGTGVIRFGTGGYFSRTMNYETLALEPLEKGTGEKIVMALLR